MSIDIKYHPLENRQDLDPLLEAIGDSRIVMLGEASHGTSEYYTWRTAISRRLIEEKGFNFIAVEGDWPDCYAVNRFVKGYEQAGKKVGEVLQTFNRWPSWMWANWEVAALAEWLLEHNQEQPPERKAGFYGLDVYSLWESMQEIVAYLEKNDGQAVAAAKRAYNCFEPFSKDPQAYAWGAGFVSESCEEEVVRMLQEISAKKDQFRGDPEGNFNAEQNALVAVNAERYYRAMVRGGGKSWNVRDRHMMETLNRLLDFHGPDSKAIVWEHNTHIGDARATDMADDGMYNIGQLAREEHGKENVFLVGFGSNKGTVIAGAEWGAPMQRMRMPEGRTGSWEYFLHDISEENKLILMEDLRHIPEFQKQIGHRAIGVVYSPQMERFGNYVPSVMPERYDAFLYFDETEAVHPFHFKPAHGAAPELYPWYY